MIDYKTLKEHLENTGRLKLLPRILSELKREEVRAAKSAPRTETAKKHPELLSGSRTLENGLLTDSTGKRALLEIYQRVIS